MIARGTLITLLMISGLLARGDVPTGQQGTSETESTTLKNRLRDEASKSWGELEAAAKRIRVHYTVERSSSNRSGPSPSSTDEYDAAISGDMVVRRRLFGSGPTEEILLKNGRYAGKIGRVARTPDTRFAIQWMEKYGADEAVDKQVDDASFEVHAAVTGAWKDSGKSYDEITEIPGFTLKNVTAEGPYVRVEFDCCPEDKRKYRYWRKNGYFIMDPINGWALREFGADFQNGATMRAVLEYDASALGSFPLLRKRTVSITKGDSTSKQITVYSNWSQESIPESEFRFSHFNLPEPNFSTGGRRWSFWIYVNLGVISLIVAYFLWRRRRQTA